MFARRAREIILREEARGNHGYGGLLAAMVARIDGLETRIGQDATDAAPSTALGGAIGAERQGLDGLEFEIRGPAADDCFTFTVDARGEAELVVCPHASDGATPSRMPSWPLSDIT